MNRILCSVDHQEVAASSDLGPWLKWPRVCIEDYTFGKTFETRRCPVCHAEFKRQIYITAVVYPVEVTTEQPFAEAPVRELPPPATRDWPEEPRQFALVLRRRREAAGLTRVELSVLSGVCDSTIRNIEMYRHLPSTRIIARLTAVPELQAITVRETAVDTTQPELRVRVQPAPPIAPH